MVLKLLKADDGAEAAGCGDQPTPRPRGRFCEVCKAFVTVLGRTEGVFCEQSSCPYPRLNWGGVNAHNLQGASDAGDGVQPVRVL